MAKSWGYGGIGEEVQITPSMVIEGACVLEGYLAGDDDLRELSPSEVVRKIYSRMHRVRPEAAR